MSNLYNKPLPEVYAWTAPFWSETKNGRLMLQRGKTTEKFIMYPKKYSPYDFTEEIEWVEASGKGTIYSYSTVYANPPASFADDLPFTVAIVELEEGVRLCTRIVDTPPDKIAIGVTVSPVYEKVTDDITLVYFKAE
ncbi:acyl dehydratase [Clostridia bacterium]|nr:acyl dehydratase [Clostridia bacterium]